MNSNNPYGIRTNGNRHGDVFTQPLVVNYMLDLVGYIADRDLSHISILEPSCGEGEFVVEILRRLSASAKSFNFDADKAAHANVFAYEMDSAKIEKALQRIESLHLGYQNISTFIQQGDFLQKEAPQVDIVVGNPPYVRYEQLPEEIITFCKRTFSTFHYRADLYIPFYEKTLRLLKPDGKHCFICSNRWLKNEYGRKLRMLISKMYCLELLVDMEEANPFQEKVSAYTDILMISYTPMKPHFRFCKIGNLNDLGDTSKEIVSPSPKGEDWTRSFNQWDEEDGLRTIEELGLKIGIGVATGADRVFISNDLNRKIEQELLIPLISGRDLRGNAFNWSGLFLFNPYKPDGTLIDLQEYPHAMKYLLQHEEKLKTRHIAKKNPKYWYRTIDRIYPELQHQPKILLPDMSANTFIFVDEGAYYPAHNLYYVTGSNIRHLKLLSAILMSDFISRQLSNITNSMNGGFSRWQSQHLHKLRVPDVLSFEEERIELLLDAYDKFDLDAINKILDDILSRSTGARSNLPKTNQKTHQLSLAF